MSSPSRAPLPLNEAEWLISGAAVRGKGHIDGGQPCQDWCATRTSADGRWVAAVVCDGAGSAAKAEEGARTVAEGFADRLITLAPKVDVRGPGPWIRDEVHRSLIELREQLRGRDERAREDIRHYDCTVVACLVGPTGGMIVHVGDGLALAAKVRVHGDAPGEPIGLWDGLIVSPPENGEYANETMFVTQDDWYAHLRTTPLSQDLDLLVLTTDGMMPFVVLNGLQPNSRFLDPVVAKLLRTVDPRERARLVESWLGAPETFPATNDDKTLVFLLRRRLIQLSHRPIAPHIVTPVLVTPVLVTSVPPVPPSPPAPPAPIRPLEAAPLRAPEPSHPSEPSRAPEPSRVTREPRITVPPGRATGRVVAWVALALAIVAVAVAAGAAALAYRVYERQVAEQKAPPKPAVVPPDPPAAGGNSADGKAAEPVADKPAPKSTPKGER